MRMIPRREFIELLKKDGDALYKRYVRLNEELVSSFARMNALEHPKAGDKVAFMLLSLAEQFGTKLRPYKTRLRLAMTQQEMADALGLTRETTGIELRKLELRHIISHSRKNYILYMERLQKYVERH
jgi:CRP-like cAMP-binding protein